MQVVDTCYNYKLVLRIKANARDNHFRLYFLKAVFVGISLDFYRIEVGGLLCQDCVEEKKEN